VLHPVVPAKLPADRPGGEVLRDFVHKKDKDGAERAFAAMAQTADDALNHLLAAVEDATEVHRVVMVYRSWDALDLVGKEQAQTLLRQSVRYCTQNCSDRYDATFGGARRVVPNLLDQYKLVTRKAGNRTADDSFIEKLSQTIFRSTPEQAAEAAAAALAEGFAPDIIGQ